MLILPSIPLASAFHDHFAAWMSHVNMPFQQNTALWYGIGITGTLIFGSRTFVQWVYSEKHRESKIPIIYWRLSVLGTVICLSYAIRQKDPVFMMMYTFNMIPYVRNLMLIRKRKNETKTQAFPVKTPVSAAA